MQKHIKIMPNGVTVLPERTETISGRKRVITRTEEVDMGKILASQVCHWKEWEILDGNGYKDHGKLGFVKLKVCPFEQYAQPKSVT